MQETFCKWIAIVWKKTWSKRKEYCFTIKLNVKSDSFDWIAEKWPRPDSIRELFAIENVNRHELVAQRVLGKV